MKYNQNKVWNYQDNSQTQGFQGWGLETDWKAKHRGLLDSETALYDGDVIFVQTQPSQHPQNPDGQNWGGSDTCK